MGSDLVKTTKDWLGRIARGGGFAGAGGRAGRGARQAGRGDRPAQDAGRDVARGAAERRAAHPRPARGRHRGDRGAQGGARGSRAGAAAGDRAARHDAARRAGGRGQRPSGQPGDGRARRDFRRSRLLGRDRARDRGRLAQFHRAQHPRKPPGAGDARHLLLRPHRWRRPADAASDPHLAGPDPDDADRSRRRSTSSRRAAPTAPTATRPTRRCSTRSKGW